MPINQQTQIGGTFDASGDTSDPVWIAIEADIEPSRDGGTVTARLTELVGQ